MSESGTATDADELDRWDRWQDYRGYLLLGAWGGTALAGGVFGVMLCFWEFVYIELRTTPLTLDSIGEGAAAILTAVILSFPGFAIGFVYAGMVGAPVLGALRAVILGIGSTRTPTWVASLIGAWTAFCCCGFYFAPVPIALGQVGATLVGQRYALRFLPQPGHDEARSTSHQFGLRRLFRFTTVVCVLFAIFSLLPIGGTFRMQVGYCVVWQAVSILAVIGVRSVWAKRST